MMRKILLWSSVQGLASALYGSGSAVEMLDAAKLAKIQSGDEPWMVEFYASWCGHCKTLAPEYEKAAKALKGIVNLGAVEDQSVMQQFGVQGFPSIKFFGDDSPQDYQGARTAAGIVDYILQKVSATAKARLSGRSGGGSSSSGSGSSGGAGEVMVLTDSNFEENVFNSEDFWFIKFYAPWCGHCTQMAPAWEELAGSLQGKVRIAKLDATEHTAMASKFGVNGFPTIKFFAPGATNEASAIDYDGGRDADSMRLFAESKFMASVKAGQLTNKKQFAPCEDKLCVVAFIPHILDSNAKERNGYLDMYNDAIRAAGVSAEFFWSQGGDQFDLEESLRLSFGYPALVAISKKKNVYGTHRGSFSKEGIRGFLMSMGSRGARLDKLPESLKIVGADEWDGKDGSLPVEEDL